MAPARATDSPTASQVGAGVCDEVDLQQRSLVVAVEAHRAVALQMDTLAERLQRVAIEVC